MWIPLKWKSFLPIVCKYKSILRYRLGWFYKERMVGGRKSCRKEGKEERREGERQGRREGRKEIQIRI